MPTATTSAQQPPSAAHLLGTTVGGSTCSPASSGVRRPPHGRRRRGRDVGLHRHPPRARLGLPRRLGRPTLVVIADAIYAFPTLLLAIVVAIAISGSVGSALGIIAAAASITVVFIPQYFRVVRAEVVRVKTEAFVESAKVIGASTPRIMFRHVLRNSTRTLPLIVTLNASEAISTLAALGFLGFGIQPTAAAEWGYDLNKSISDVAPASGGPRSPGLAIVLTVLGITLIGESLNDLADPRLRAAPREREADAAGCRRHDAADRAEILGRFRDDREHRSAVEIRHLDVTFATDGATSTPCATCRSTSGPASARDRRRVRQGKTVTARSILGLLPETAPSAARSCSTARRRGPVVREAARGARHEGRDDLPGAVDGPEPRLHGGLAARRGPARARVVLARRGEGEGRRDARPVGIPDPERASTTTRTSSRAGRSSASSSRWRSRSTRP
jgi:peptide/nickel transport system permease protein